MAPFSICSFPDSSGESTNPAKVIFPFITPVSVRMAGDSGLSGATSILTTSRLPLIGLRVSKGDVFTFRVALPKSSLAISD